MCSEEDNEDAKIFDLDKSDNEDGDSDGEDFDGDNEDLGGEKEDFDETMEEDQDILDEQEGFDGDDLEGLVYLLPD